ncbi:MAG: hypothetical protein ACJ8AN_16495, partial [Archangium sp.]
MKKVGSGGLPPTLQKLITDASHSGKQIGAPKLHKALHGHHLGQLKKADPNQLRDIFEHLTPKAKALAEKLLGGAVSNPRVKIKADEPTTAPTSGGLGSLPGVVKIKADEPTAAPTSGGLGSLPGVVKIKADEPTAAPTSGGLGSLPGVVK